METKLADLRSDFELLDAETFEILDYEDGPEMLAGGCSTSSCSCSSSTTSCTSTASCA
ncbi:thiazolylpeptide-type bacteriocin precursor [Actinomadura pelletieri DSM 43383]|uniref:Thiazolylpeptide-type bacteriocin n=1 Tax=Actinomadura pelletieri DSM 43383 TaxID=1120940 RepID=A0A495QGE9_9ACTN|nr:thiazolylpeptide-type bacteriocin [Actinomadura pelletieri]RKS70992.1 thiazolylpeptide-type bacteriocin precursor [Actinomadura pelletieri DSM 43383]